MSTKKTKTTKPSKKTNAKAASAPKETVVTAAKGAKAPSAKAKKATTDKPKRTSALDAAATVLNKAGKPMRSQELIDAMAAQGLWKSPGGKTPHATLYAAILREITAKGKAARFKKIDRGQFEFAG
jgi:hypothetical protein